MQILPINCVSLSLCRILDVGLGQQFLNAQQDLLHSDRGSPVLFLVQQRQTHGSRWVNVGVKKWRFELALRLGRRVIILKIHLEFVKATFPICLCAAKQTFTKCEKTMNNIYLCFAGNGALPFLQVVCIIRIFDRFSEETLRKSEN